MSAQESSGPGHQIEGEIAQLQAGLLGVGDVDPEKMRQIFQQLNRIIEMGGFNTSEAAANNDEPPSPQPPVERPIELVRPSKKPSAPRTAGRMAAASHVDIQHPVDPAERQRRQQRRNLMASNYAKVFAADGTMHNPRDDFVPRPHQPRVFASIGKAIQSGPDKYGAIVIPIRAAGGIGKNPIAVKTVQALTAAESPDDQPFRTLHLVPDLASALQTVGTDFQGYKTFAPEIEVGQHFDNKKDSSKPVTVMTYKGLAALSDAEFENWHNTVDIVVADETHRAYGPRIGARVRQLIHREGVVSMLTSATMDFKEDHNLETALGVKNEYAVDISTRQAIEDGISNGAHIVLLATGAEVTISSVNHITSSDIAPLIRDAPRNQMALDIMQMNAEEGVTGITHCIRGDESQHARMLAAMASERTIQDPETGEDRPLRVMAVGNFQSNSENQRVLQLFSQRKIDFITFTDLLLENYDEENVEAVLDLEPTMSVVNTDQLFNRGSRLKRMITRYYQFVDKYNGRGRNIRLFLDTIEERQYDVQRVYGKAGKPPNAGRRNSGDRQSGYVNPTSHQSPGIHFIPAGLVDAAEAHSGRTLADITLVAKVYEQAPDDWLPLNNISLSHIYSQPTVVKLLEDNGIEIRRGPRNQMYTPPNIEELVKGLAKPSASYGMVAAIHIKREAGISGDLFNRIVGELGVTTLRMHSNTRTRKPGDYVNVSEAMRILSFLHDSYPTVDPSKEVTINKVAEDLYRNRTQIRIAANHLGISLGSKFGPTRKETSVLSFADAERIRKHLGVLVPKDVSKTTELADAAGLPEEELLTVIRTGKFAAKLQGGHLKNGSQINWLQPADAEAFLGWWQSTGRQAYLDPAAQKQPQPAENAPVKPEAGAKSVEEIADIYESTPGVVRSIIARLKRSGDLDDTSTPGYYSGQALSLISQNVANFRSEHSI